jgi:hypothetical protein
MEKVEARIVKEETSTFQFSIKNPRGIEKMNNVPP